MWINAIQYLIQIMNKNLSISENSFNINGASHDHERSINRVLFADKCVLLQCALF